MLRLFRCVVMVAFVAIALSSMNIASASQIRSSIERHQHPGLGFFAKDTCHHSQVVRLIRR